MTIPLSVLIVTRSSSAIPEHKSGPSFVSPLDEQARRCTNWLSAHFCTIRIHLLQLQETVGSDNVRIHSRILDEVRRHDCRLVVASDRTRVGRIDFSGLTETLSSEDAILAFVE